MDTSVIINQMAVLFILIAAGYISGRINMLTPDGVKTLSKIVINISTPSTVLYSVLGDTDSITGSKTIYFVLMTLLAFVIFFLIAIPSARALGVREGSGVRVQGSGDGNTGVRLYNNTGLYTSMIVFGNVGFMGYPVTRAIFGASSIFYAALFNIIFNVLTYSVGIILISGNVGKVNLKVLLNGTLVASLISFIIVFTGFHAPTIIVDAISLASGINTPCAMLVIGATLAQVPVKIVFTKWRLYPVTVVKMIVAPVVTWLVFKQFVTDELLFGILVVLSGMPIAAAVAMIAVEYGGDERLASSGIFLTTLLSGVTIPLIVYLFLL